MENQKLLWIIFSVALFLVVVLAGTLYFLKPGGGDGGIQSAGIDEPVSIGFDSVEYVRGTSEHLEVREQSEEPPSTGTLQIVVGESDEESAPAAEDSGSAATTETSAGSSVAPAVIQVQPRVQPRAQPVERSVTRTAPAPSTPAAAARPKPAPVPAQLYWIQTASYARRSSAEAMVEALASRGITSRIQIKDVDGGTYFRVRIGPYTVKSEAEKFLAWVKGVDGLEQSYISLVYVKQG